MYQDIRDKKLLILGAYETEKEIIEAAHTMGLYVITTDNHTNWNDAPAKFISDEAWNISWSDIEKLANKCRDEHVDGIMAGFSEKRVAYAQQLAQNLGKPFYAEGAKTEVIFDKLSFKRACIEADIKVPKRFLPNSEVAFPVIVKPSDNGGSRGITICYTQDELSDTIQRALSFSETGEVVIEEYLTNDEIMVYFTVHNGIATLSAMCDRYMHRFDEKITQLPVGYYYPSKYLGVFIQYNLEKFKKLIHFLGIRNGLIAFQAFVKDNDVIPFDPTYRLDGTMTYRITEKKNGTNVLKMLIYYSITGCMGQDDEIILKEKPMFKTPALELPILLRNGTICKIEGLEDVKMMDDVIFVYQGHSIGETMKSVADFSQIFCRIHLCAVTNSILEEDIEKIYNQLHVYDENGHDMIIGRRTFTVGG